MRIGKNPTIKTYGFTYLALLFSVAIFSVGLATTGVIWSSESTRAKEKELEFVGGEFVRAIESYYNKSPGEVKTYPQSLDDLTNDRRFLFTIRHLRKIYKNPFSNKVDWILVIHPQGGICGIKVALTNSNPNKQRIFIFSPYSKPTNSPL